MKSPLMLIILDGWGINPEPKNNAIALAKTPHYDAWLRDYPHAQLDASGHAVGLPAGVMGNSEDGSFFKNPALLGAFAAAKQNRSTLHLMGLLSDGGVHSHQDHLYALLEMA